MEENKIILHPAFDLNQTTTKIRLSDVFTERRNYLDELNLFLAYFNSIPNFIHEIEIDCRKARKWFEENYKSEIKLVHFDKLYIPRGKHAEIDDIFYFLYDDLIVDFDTNHCIVRFLFNRTEYFKVDQIIKEIHKFKKRKRKATPEISLLVEGCNGIESKTLKIRKPRLSIDHNYNNDFKEIHQTILKRLSRKNDKGLVLLHGKPGTGKTSYIRFLITSLNKNVIFLPPNLTKGLTDPGLISVLIGNPNSIFVIEDAENIVVDREKDGNSPVSSLLNISDGLLADCLDVQIICSFNTDITKIDSALMRKGRLIAKYEFKELEIEKAQQLSDKLGFKSTVTRPMSLASIYNQDEKDYQNIRKYSSIGFQGVN